MPAGLLEITELRLGLPGERVCVLEEKKGKKRAFCEDHEDGKDGEDDDEDELGRVKDRVVGWPPICSYRQKTKSSCRNGVRYVKVSMDGAPFLRKIDLNLYRGYSDLSLAFRKLFGSLRIGEILSLVLVSYNFSVLYFIWLGHLVDHVFNISLYHS